jgi:hypothetical protein
VIGKGVILLARRPNILAVMRMPPGVVTCMESIDRGPRIAQNAACGKGQARGARAGGDREGVGGLAADGGEALAVAGPPP